MMTVQVRQIRENVFEFTSIESFTEGLRWPTIAQLASSGTSVRVAFPNMPRREATEKMVEVLAAYRIATRIIAWDEHLTVHFVEHGDMDHFCSLVLELIAQFEEGKFGSTTGDTEE